MPSQRIGLHSRRSLQDARLRLQSIRSQPANVRLAVQTGSRSPGREHADGGGDVDVGGERLEGRGRAPGAEAVEPGRGHVQAPVEEVVWCVSRACARIAAPRSTCRRPRSQYSACSAGRWGSGPGSKCSSTRRSGTRPDRPSASWDAAKYEMEPSRWAGARALRVAELTNDAVGALLTLSERPRGGTKSRRTREARVRCAYESSLQPVCTSQSRRISAANGLGIGPTRRRCERVGRLGRRPLRPR